MRDLYNAIDDIKDLMYGLCRDIQLIEDVQQSKHMARYAFKELLPAFDSLLFSGGTNDRIRYSTEDRSGRNVETGHGPVADDSPENVGRWGLP